jgi:hypothetical protein
MRTNKYPKCVKAARSVNKSNWDLAYAVLEECPMGTK